MLSNQAEAVGQGSQMLAGTGYIVVGTGANIGSAVAHALARHGAKVACLDVDQASAEQVAGEIQGVPVVADVTDQDAFRSALLAAAAQVGPVAGVIDIVGNAIWEPIPKIALGGWRRQFELSVEHVLTVVQTAPDLLADGAGALTFVSSTSSMSGAPAHAAYGAAKAALNSLVKSAAIELAPSGIRVNAVAPSLVWTAQFQRLMESGGIDETELLASIPLGRLGRPEEIAQAVLFLTSPMASYVTGQILIVDGGLTSKLPWPGIPVKSGEADV